MVLVSFIFKITFLCNYFQKNDFDFRDRARACVVSIYDTDVSVSDLSMTDLKALSDKKPTTESISGLFSSFVSDQASGELYYFLFSFEYALFS